MLRYYKFHESAFAPRPAREAYVKRPAGQGWPEQCPPVRQANAFGWDVLSNFDLRFVRLDDGSFALEEEHALPSDWDMADDASRGPAGDDDDGDADGGGEEREPLQVQRAAWFWDPEQQLPHPISPEVYKAIRHQVKVSSFLFLRTDPGEVLLVTEVPNRHVPYRAVSALIETDWYPASYPWHGVLELDPREARIRIPRGEPLCRLIPLRRDTYMAQAMSAVEFTEFFDRGQLWLQQHGHAVEPDGTVDIRRSYRKQQLPSRFWTDEPFEEPAP